MSIIRVQSLIHDEDRFILSFSFTMASMLEVAKSQK